MSGFGRAEARTLLCQIPTLFQELLFFIKIGRAEARPHEKRRDEMISLVGPGFSPDAPGSMQISLDCNH
jgi:hypothetical protein